MNRDHADGVRHGNASVHAPSARVGVRVRGVRSNAGKDRPA